MSDKEKLMEQILELVGEEWADWYLLSPQERFKESQKLWQFYLSVGGSLDPEPDSQSPFYFPEERYQGPANGRAGLRFIRGGGV